MDNTALIQFVDCFFFSVQTGETIGFGMWSPVSTYVNAVVVFESFTSLLMSAIITGKVGTTKIEDQPLINPINPSKPHPAQSLSLPRPFPPYQPDPLPPATPANPKANHPIPPNLPGNPNPTQLSSILALILTTPTPSPT